MWSNSSKSARRNDDTLTTTNIVAKGMPVSARTITYSQENRQNDYQISNSNGNSNYNNTCNLKNNNDNDNRNNKSHDIDTGTYEFEDMISCESTDMFLDSMTDNSVDLAFFGDDETIFQKRPDYDAMSAAAMSMSAVTTTSSTTATMRATSASAREIERRGEGDCSESLSRKRRLLVSDDDEKSGNGGTNIATASATTTATPPAIAAAVQDADDGLENITEKMGKLWWPTSNQDLSKIHRRDKHGRLVLGDNCEAVDRRKSGIREGLHSVQTPEANAETKTKSTEWYNNVVKTVYAATVNLLGTATQTGSANEKYDNPKLKTSMQLTNTIDKFWAKELYEMDAREREEITNEIHGIRSNRATQETPESIEKEVRSFRNYIKANLGQELDNEDSIVPPVTKDAYHRGIHQLKSDYIVSKDFLIKFLRICRYDLEQAHLRYFRYLDLLYVLFGDDSLTRPLALSDLTKRELRYLRKGQMQLLPSRDRAGRRIFAFSGCDDYNFNIREKYRTNIYLIDVLSDDVATQQLGAVSLNAPRCRDGDNPFGFEGMTLRMGKQELLGGKHTEAEFFRKINEGVPIRFTAIHYFAPATLIYNIGRAIILTMLGKDHRKMVRFHAGSQLECNYGLKSFGIPHDDITITEGNNIKTKNVQKFLNARRSIESFREKQQAAKKLRKQQQQQESPDQSPNEEDDIPEEECPGIECPGVDCIVFGDKTMNGLPANVEFREMLKVMEREREKKLNNCEGNVLPIKQFIESIIDAARSSEHNLRFLVFDKKSHLFVDIDDRNELCKRVSQALRDQRKRARIEEQRLVVNQATKNNCVGACVAAATGAKGGRRTDTATNTTTATAAATATATINQQGHHWSCVLEEAGGSSIIGIGAAKRLKQSSDGDCFFCTHQKSHGRSHLHTHFCTQTSMQNSYAPRTHKHTQFQVRERE